MDIIISLSLVFLSVFFTVLLYLFHRDPDLSNAFDITFCVITIVFWIIAGISFIDLTSTLTHVVSDAVVEHTVHYENSWLLTLPLSMLGSVYPFFLILKQVWKSWGF